MKFFIVSFFLLSVVCNKPDQEVMTCYKGKLVLKGICMNYVIEVLEGNIDKSLYESSWKNPLTGTTYQNVFALDNICYFSASINQGDEFYFYIPKNPPPNTCAQCLAYSPTPDKKIYIQICPK